HPWQSHRQRPPARRWRDRAPRDPPRSRWRHPPRGLRREGGDQGRSRFPGRLRPAPGPRDGRRRNRPPHRPQADRTRGRKPPACEPFHKRGRDDPAPAPGSRHRGARRPGEGSGGTDGRRRCSRSGRRPRGIRRARGDDRPGNDAGAPRPDRKRCRLGAGGPGRGHRSACRRGPPRQVAYPDLGRRKLRGAPAATCGDRPQRRGAGSRRTGARGSGPCLPGRDRGRAGIRQGREDGMLMQALEKKVLVVEDTALLTMLYRNVLGRAGHDVTVATTLAEARAELEARNFALVLLDLQLPDGDGMALLHELRARRCECRVIVITANGSINRAVEAMRAGALDFVVKPFDEARLMGAVNNAIAQPVQVAEVTPPGDEPPCDQPGELGFIGSSAPMRSIYRMVRSIGRSTATVFITGESGTGKEVCARAIHAVSTRADKPFVPLNCAAIPRDLLESEVFGHLKGAFTGALADKPGAAAVANGGTLFLDEICEMDLSLQTKLLRFLQTSTIQPVGSARSIPVDVRIVCATNRDPEEEVHHGRFREDLFYRLHV